MNGEERARILRMVAEGKVSPVEAEDLLAALEPAPRAATGASSAAVPGAAFSRRDAPSTALEGSVMPRSFARRNLVVRVGGGGSKVNLRIPLGLARAAGRFLPRQAQEALSNYSIDLERILESVANGPEEGTLLEVQDGDEHVLIAVE
jgi:hypothetical protein